jgi:hypothetical protein
MDSSSGNQQIVDLPKKQKTINFHPDNRKFERGKKGSKML